MSAYQTLERRFARLAAINDALGILHWDTETLMPPGAADGRAEQLATLKVLSHELLTDDDNADLLADAEHERELSNWQEANLHEMRRAYLHATAVPGDLVEASSRAISRCEMVWRDARPAGDFAMLLPSLSEVLNLQRQIAAAKATATSRAATPTISTRCSATSGPSCRASSARCWSARRAARTSCLSRGRSPSKPSGRWASG